MLSVIAAAKVMYRLDQRTHVLRVRELRHPVAQVKHMPGTRAVRRQNLGDLRTNLRRLGE